MTEAGQPLREFFLGVCRRPDRVPKAWSRGRDLNPRLADYETERRFEPPLSILAHFLGKLLEPLGASCADDSRHRRTQPTAAHSKSHRLAHDSARKEGLRKGRR